MRKCYFLLLLPFLFAANLAIAQPAGRALDFAGGSNPATGDYVTLPGALVESLTGAFTLEAYVRFEGTTQYQRIFDFGNDISNFLLLTPKSETGFAKFGIVVGGVVQAFESTVPFPSNTPPNTYTHIAVSVDNTNTGRMYFDGALVGMSAVGAITFRPADFNGATAENWIGRSRFAPNPGFSDEYFDGQIDEVRISNSARYTGSSFPLPGEFTADANTVALYHFNEPSGEIVDDASTAGTFDGYLGSDAAVVDANNPTRITIAVLPITMLQFSAQKSGSAADLKWKAVSTGSGGAFIIERSDNGSRFQPIGNVVIPAVAGTSSYSFSDNSPLKGRNYYRIKIMETNAPTKYSSVAIVDLSGKDYSAYPSVTSSDIYINVPKKTQVAIYNNAGTLVKKVLLETSQHVNVSQLSKGVYQIRFEGSKETVRFIKM